jgi:hypothetical protein
LDYFDMIKNKKTTKSMICGLLSGIGFPFRRGTRTIYKVYNIDNQS